MVNRWYFGAEMTELNIQAVLPDPVSPHIARRKVFAIGWVQVKPARQNAQPTDTLGNLNVLGVVVVEEEFGTKPGSADLA
jgi:hypothetical protein